MHVLRIRPGANDVVVLVCRAFTTLVCACVHRCFSGWMTPVSQYIHNDQRRVDHNIHASVLDALCMISCEPQCDFSLPSYAGSLLLLCLCLIGCIWKMTHLSLCIMQAHSSAQKAAMISGTAHLRVLKTKEDTDWALQADTFQQAVQQDLEAGLVPFYLFTTAGTTSTATVDDLRGLSTVARQHNIW